MYFVSTRLVTGVGYAYLEILQLFLQDKDNFGRQTEVIVIITDVVIFLDSKDISSIIYVLLMCILVMIPVAFDKKSLDKDS